MSSHFYAEIFAFLIILWVIWRYIVPVARRAMRQRQEAIREQLEESRRAKEEMERAEAEYERAHETAAGEADELREDARVQSGHIVAELRERAQLEAERILQRGREQLAAERDTLVREVRTDVGRLAVDLAERIVTEAMRDDGRRRATVERALTQIRVDEQAAEPREPAVVAAEELL